MAGYTPKREGYDLMKKSFLSLFGSQQGQPANRRRLLALLAPLTVLGLAVCICMSPAPADESVYMLIDSESIHTVTADSGLDYDSSALYAAPHSAGAADVQLILNKGQQVQVSNAVQGVSASAKRSSNGVQLLAEQQGLIAVLAEANVVAGLNHVQALLKGTLLLSVHLLVIFIGVCHEICLISFNLFRSFLTLL